ncbi:MAG: hypothetical protein KAW02_02190, partial [candidate division Zixibacteria bacterium]|nr:hypothetical protein [candidate division Zixibacteria bacterium]
MGQKTNILRYAQNDTGIRNQVETMKYVVQIEGKSYQVDLSEQDGEVQVNLDGKPVQADSVHIKGKNFVSFLFNNRSFDLEFSKN